MKLHVMEAIVVEGRYDKSRLSSLVDGVIIETNGFGIFKDKKRMELLRRLARERGLIVLTDSDSAGFLIRGRIGSCISPRQIKNAYIPDLYGKEGRKAQPSKEGKLGVEGMSLETLRFALERAGATIIESEPGISEGESEMAGKQTITKADLYELGLYGGKNSRERRLALLKAMELPEHLSANGLVRVAGALYEREEFFALVAGLNDITPEREGKESIDGAYKEGLE